MTETPDPLMVTHNIGFDEATRNTVCECGDRGHAGYLAHIAGLLGTDETGARQALLKAHTFTEINPGMCGGCETCGSDSVSAVCAICGEGDSPCGAYFEAILNADGTPFEFPSTEGQK
ncbi:hypothetical protein [Arthrobacter sp. UYCo732]|uniref:hypothetical protein n=1 Tax=Arthrobacter sp. UYCo732 TaxID=3156336 RepID=UPI003393B30A